MGRLRVLEEFLDDKEFHGKWRAIKLENKRRLAHWIKKNTGLGIGLSSDWLFDVQVKRIHEYKRQLTNILYTTHGYLSIKAIPEQRKSVVARVVMFGGKAAPGYFNAKRITRLVNEVAEAVNNDHTTKPSQGGVPPNYNVSNPKLCKRHQSTCNP